jgi:hypothetical protein
LSVPAGGERLDSDREVDRRTGIVVGCRAGGGLLDNDELEMRQVALGMDVCDVSGEKVGTVAHIHHPTPTREVIEVKTGPLGLGKHLYVQAEQVDAVTEAGLILKHAKQEFHDAGLDTKPEGLED